MKGTLDNRSPRSGRYAPNDLVVLGGEWRHGRGQGDCCLTDELLAWQTEVLLARETARDAIAVLVAPEPVIETDGVQSSTR
jgi:hypothetical protein